MASRQTSRICFSWVFCFVDVDFALDFVLLIGIFVAFTVSTFVRFHSIVGAVGAVGVVVAIAAVDTVGVAVASVIVAAAAVVPVVVVVEHWPDAILPLVAHSYLAAIDFDNFSLALSNDVFVGGDSELVVVVDIGDNGIGGSGRCSMLRFI